MNAIVKFTMVMVIYISQVTTAEPILEIAKEEWELYKLEYNKTYDNVVEEQFRMKIFMENRLKVLEHNELFAQNLTSYKMKTNHLSDLLYHEILATMNIFQDEEGEDMGSIFIPPDDDVILPTTVDWRKKGIVTPVKNQRQCGSCWAFSAVGSLEGQHARKTGHLVSLSEQNLVDCCTLCHGCGGGLMSSAFKCIYHDHGIDSEGYYPYTGHDGTCKYNRQMAAANLTGYAKILKGSEAALMKAVAIVGPIAVGVDAIPSFMHYSSGVYSDPNCSPVRLNHGVLVVGYGRQYGVDYWLVKNSWGPLWGDHGYIKIARNRYNMCGIATMASFPLV